MESIQKISVLISVDDLIKENVNRLRKDVIIAICCERNYATKELQLLYDFLFIKDFNSKFLIAINPTQDLNNEMMSCFMRLFHHTNYLVNGNVPELILIQEPDEVKRNKKNEREIIIKAQEQGWQNVTYNHFVLKNLFKENNNITVCVDDDYVYEEELTKLFFATKILLQYNFLIKSKFLQSAYFIIDKIKNLEAEYQQANPEVYQLILKAYSAAAEIIMLRRDYIYVSNELKNQEKYVSVLRNEDETKKILNFYHSEYEVLPLWYKQFGHIIKLLTGKRKLKSFLGSYKK